MHLKHFCRSLQVGTFKAVREDWKNRLLEEYEAFDRFLLPTDELSTSYPRKGHWDCYRVVLHQDGTIVGIDDEDDDNRITLRKEEIILQKFDLKRFRREICSGFCLKAANGDIGDKDRQIPWGTWEPEKVKSFPVTLLIQGFCGNFRERIFERILRADGKGEILLTPTRFAWDDDLETLAYRSKILLVPLDEIVRLEDGRFLPMPVWKEYLNAFRKMMDMDIPSPSPIPEKISNEFRKQGNMWIVRYKGEGLYWDNWLGLRYIALLLAKPHQPIFAYELRRLLTGLNLPEQQENTSSDKSIDNDYIKSLADRYRVLQTELEKAQEENDRLVHSEIEKEMEQIITFLKKNTHKGVARKNGGSEYEKARISVFKTTGAAMKVLEKRLPSLHDHLRNSLEIGMVCNYRPKDNICWNL